MLSSKELFQYFTSVTRINNYRATMSGDFLAEFAEEPRLDSFYFRQFL